MDKIKKALEKASEISSPKLGPSRSRQVITPSYTQTRVVKVDPEHLRRHKIFSYFTEEALTESFKILRTRIINTLEDMQGNTLLITSANPGEGKTLTAINLAVSLAQEFDRTVLLVDANLKAPAVHTYLGLPVEKGLAQVILGEATVPEVLVNPGLPRLVVLPAGKPFPGSAELLGAPSAEEVFHDIKSRYAERIIIIDSPAVLHTADPLVLAEYADGVLFLAEAERTPSEDVQKAQELLKEKPLAAVVLNKYRA